LSRQIFAAGASPQHFDVVLQRSWRRFAAMQLDRMILIVSLCLAAIAVGLVLYTQ